MPCHGLAADAGIAPRSCVPGHGPAADAGLAPRSCVPIHGSAADAGGVSIPPPPDQFLKVDRSDKKSAEIEAQAKREDELHDKNVGRHRVALGKYAVERWPNCVYGAV